MSETNTTDTTLTIRLDASEEVRRQARERIAALERGEEVEDQHVLVLEDETELARLLRPANVELLSAIANHDPESMRQAAELVDRDFKEVHRNLTELANLNVIELERDGQAKRPVLRYDSFDVEVQFGRSPPATSA